MDAAERACLIEQVLLQQWEFVRAALSSAGPRWLQLDLTMGQLKALVTVAEAGPLPVGRLGAALGIGKPAATLLVDALVRRGLVERSEDPEDRRRTLVRLSAQGGELMDELLRGRRDRLAGWLAQLDDDDLLALARGLRALVAVAAAQSQARSA